MKNSQLNIFFWADKVGIVLGCQANLAVFQHPRNLSYANSDL